jgi:hypothetical protein
LPEIGITPQEFKSSFAGPKLSNAIAVQRSRPFGRVPEHSAMAKEKNNWKKEAGDAKQISK